MAENGEIFAGRVGPDLYRTNAFRITQIFVDATDSEIRRKANKIKLAQKYAKGQSRLQRLLPTEARPDLGLGPRGSRAPEGSGKNG